MHRAVYFIAIGCVSFITYGLSHGAQYNSPREVASQLAGKLTETKKTKADLLKISIALASYDHFVSVDKKGEETSHIRRKPLKRFLLNARTKRINHFFIEGLHLVIRPVAWVRETGSYEFSIDVMKSFGNFRRVEESLGHWNLKGYLHAATTGYSFVGYSQQDFKNKRGEPVVHMEIGHTSKKTLELSAKKNSKKKGF